MSTRSIHVIHSKCDVYVDYLEGDVIRVRITEENPELLNPTDFEIEGDCDFLAEAFTDILAVLLSRKELDKEPS